MINRTVAFAVWPRELAQGNAIREHLEYLASCHGMRRHFEDLGAFAVGLVFEGDLEGLVTRGERQRMQFCVGQNLGSGFVGSAGVGVRRDRFLEVEILADEIVTTTDYAGSVPAYYTVGEDPIVSNIEPILTVGAVESPSRLSLENIYGYLRYGHLIWNETIFDSIFSQLPDHTLRHRRNCFEPKATYNRTVYASEGRINFNDRQVARDLYELNQALVEDALEPYDQIVLPLSAGYDSRMIVAACGRSDRLKKRVRAFTYGEEGAIEVESARRLCARLGIKWQRVDLPGNFLNRRYTEEILSVFGSSLHVHGMYQLEFIDTIRSELGSGSTALTSGFMTGVPAGQHNTKLGIDTIDADLSRCMNSFSQSKIFPEDVLLGEGKFNREMSAAHERRFRSAFDLFDGRPRQKAIMFDVWTRQRNFISYYPRTVEWRMPVVSPQMTPEYANFFLSLNDRHLDDRRAVELMFQHHYPEVAGIGSNSNGYRAIHGQLEDIAIFVTRALRYIGLRGIVPKAYWNLPLALDKPAMLKAGREGYYPLTEMPDRERDWLSEIIRRDYIEGLVQASSKGDELAYNRLAFLQPIAYSLKLIGKKA